MRTKFPIQLAKEHIILAAYSEAIELLRPEAEKGHPEAQFLYGFLHFLNPDLSSSDAIQLIQNAAQQDHAGAHYVLATFHDFEAEYQFEMPRTQEQWVHLEVAVQQGSIPASVQMAKAYRDAVSRPKNVRLANKLLKLQTQDKFPLYAEAYYERAVLLLNQRGPGQKQRADIARHLIFAIMYGHNPDVIRKARRLMAKTIRDPRYQFSRKEGLERLKHMKQERAWRNPGPSRPQWQHFLDDYCRRSLTYDLHQATYEEFISFLFDHPLEDGNRKHLASWKRIAEMRFSPHKLTQYYTRLFRDPTFLLEHYTPEELNVGFWNISLGLSYKDRYLTIGAVIRHQTVSVQEAEMCLEAMYDLFVKLFSRPDLPELTRDAAYMWWDSSFCNFWAYTGPETDYDRRRDALNPARRTDASTAQRFNDINLDVMKRVLQLDSIDCKWAALHGLGHLVHPGKEQVIRDFLAANPDLPDFEGWYEYGMDAIEGNVV